MIEKLSQEQVDELMLEIKGVTYKVERKPSPVKHSVKHTNIIRVEEPKEPAIRRNDAPLEELPIIKLKGQHYYVRGNILSPCYDQQHISKYNEREDRRLVKNLLDGTVPFEFPDFSKQTDRLIGYGIIFRTEDE